MGAILFPVIREAEQVLPYVLTGAASNFPVNRIARPKGSDSGWWLQTRQGSGRIITPTRVSAIGLSQAVWIAPGEPHELIADSAGWSVDWVSVNGRGVREMAEDSEGMARSAVIDLPEDDLLRDRLLAILNTRDDQSPSANRFRSSLVYSFLLEVSKLVINQENGNLSQREQRLLPVLNYIAKHYQEAIGLQTLADLMGVTPQHLCTLFRKLMGMRIFEYINLIRIQTSKAELIVSTEKAVREVAHDCGFEDVSYFCSMFKRFEKMTPGEYRKLYIHA